MSGVGAHGDGDQALRDALPVAPSYAANAPLREEVGAKRERDEEESIEERRRAGDKLYAEAEKAAVKLKQTAETEVAADRRVVQAERAALDVEKAAMEKTYAFQTKKILLNIGGREIHSSTFLLNVCTF